MIDWSIYLFIYLLTVLPAFILVPTPNFTMQDCICQFSLRSQSLSKPFDLTPVQQRVTLPNVLFNSPVSLLVELYYRWKHNIMHFYNTSRMRSLAVASQSNLDRQNAFIQSLYISTCKKHAHCRQVLFMQNIDFLSSARCHLANRLALVINLVVEIAAI